MNLSRIMYIKLNYNNDTFPDFHIHRYEKKQENQIGFDFTG